MFNFFRKRSTDDFEVYKQLVTTIARKLPDQYSYILRQVEAGAIRDIRMAESHLPNFRKFVFNGNVMNQFEDKLGRQFILKGSSVYDNNLEQYVPVDLMIAYGILIGISSPQGKDLAPDPEKIRVGEVRLQYLGETEFKEISHLFSDEELALINPSDVYDVELGGQKYYHIKDLEDGDFIGIDMQKNVYQITHDPFEVVLLKEKLTDLLHRV